MNGNEGLDYSELEAPCHFCGAPVLDIDANWTAVDMTFRDGRRVKLAAPVCVTCSTSPEPLA